MPVRPLRTLTQWEYVPALRWREAESLALSDLKAETKDRVVPLLTIPELEFDFGEGRKHKTVPSQVESFLKRYLKRWGRPAWLAIGETIAGRRMNERDRVFDFILRTLRASDDRSIVPAIELDADDSKKAEVARAAETNASGVGIIVSLPDLIPPDASSQISLLASELGASPSTTDLLVDLGAPNPYPEYAAFAAALIPRLRDLGDLTELRNFVLISTAVSGVRGSVSEGSDTRPRHDWLFYQKLTRNAPGDLRVPVYGDCTTIDPGFRAVDVHWTTTHGMIVYATQTTWATRKGQIFHLSRSQMYDHCAAIVREASFDFRGGAFSWGSKSIEECAAGVGGTRNMTWWKRVGINHHIELVVDQLAKIPAGSLSTESRR